MIVGDGGSVTAKVVGACPAGSCMPGAIDLNEKAAKQIFKGPPQDPKQNIFSGSWLPVACDMKNITASQNSSEIVIPRSGDAPVRPGIGIPQTSGKASDISNKELLQPMNSIIAATSAFLPESMCGRPADFSRLIPYLAIPGALFTPDLCGKCANVKGREGEIKAHIITGCLRCPPNVVLMSLQSAALIYPGQGGEFQFDGTWNIVDC
jgi:hypothetical protein